MLEALDFIVDSFSKKNKKSNGRLMIPKLNLSKNLNREQKNRNQISGISQTKIYLYNIKHLFLTKIYLKLTSNVGTFLHNNFGELRDDLPPKIFDGHLSSG